MSVARDKSARQSIRFRCRLCQSLKRFVKVIRYGYQILAATKLRLSLFAADLVFVGLDQLPVARPVCRGPGGRVQAFTDAEDLLVVVDELGLPG